MVPPGPKRRAAPKLHSNTDFLADKPNPIPAPAKKQIAVSNGKQPVKTGPCLELCDFFTNDPGDEPNPVWKVYHGQCMVYPTPSPNTRFIAAFEMVMRMNSNGPPQGFLYLNKEGLPTRSHELTTLWNPAMHENYCLLSTHDDQYSYRLELKDKETTEVFAAALEGLQQSLVANKKRRLEDYEAAQAAAAEEAAKVAKAACQGATQFAVREEKNEGVLIDFTPDSSTSSPSTVHTNSNIRECPARGHWATKTVDMMIRDTVDVICKITSMMASMIEEQDLDMTKASFRNLQLDLLDRWMKHGCLHNAPVLERALNEVMKTLRYFVKDVQAGRNEILQSYRKDLSQGVQEMLKRVEYTPMDLVAMWDCAAECPEAIATANFLPKPKSPVLAHKIVAETKLRYSRKSTASCPSSSPLLTSYIAPDSNGTCTPTQTSAMRNGLGTSMFANPSQANSPSAPCHAPESSMSPAMGPSSPDSRHGLASSRFA